MKKLHIFVTVLLASFITVTGSSNVSVKDTSWRPLYGYKSHISKAFIDDDNVIISAEDNSKIINGAILIVSNETRKLDIENQSITFNSVVRHVIIDCKSGIMLPIANFYFVSDMPTQKDKPVAVYKYDKNDDSNVEVLAKHSSLYMSICPDYI